MQYAFTTLTQEQAEEIAYLWHYDGEYAFNQRAVKVYQKMGFKEVELFMQETNGSHFEFLIMVYECE